MSFIINIFKVMRKTKRYLFVIFGLVLAACAAYFAWDYFYSKPQYWSYSDFYDAVYAKQVKSVKLDGDKLYFALNEASENGDDEAFGASEASRGAKSSADRALKYVTDNPHSPLLQEDFMRRGISVTVAKDSTEIISLIFDVFFYVIFFGAIIIAFRKFISPNTFKVVHKTGVRFDDVVGMDKLKRDMEQVMEIMKHPAEYAKRGVRMPKGILLEGEPGDGKTLFAKALAGEAKVNFIPAKATDFESMFMAIGPMKVKLLFKKARRRAPCIVFIDEFDGIGTVRNYSGSAIETENTRIVTALLNELDGFEPTNGVLVIAATNSIKALDPALIRPGRFDAKLTVPYPDEEARCKLVEMYTRGKSAAAECSAAALARLFNGYSCAKIESVLNGAALRAEQAGRAEFTLEDVKAAAAEA